MKWRWPWVSQQEAKAAEAAKAAYEGTLAILSDQMTQTEAARQEAAGLRQARDIRDAEIASLKADAAILDSIEAVAGLYAEKHAGETWREYNRRILIAFKEGADSTLFKAILDEVGRYERQEFVDFTEAKTASAMQASVGAARMARDLKMRLLALTGRADALSARDLERQTRAQSAFSDTEDEILGREVLDGRIPKR